MQEVEQERQSLQEELDALTERFDWLDTESRTAHHQHNAALLAKESLAQQLTEVQVRKRVDPKPLNRKTLKPSNLQTPNPYTLIWG